MDTLQFLQKILPETGIYALAEFWHGLENAPKHTHFDNIPDMVSRLEYADSSGRNVFHACAAYQTADLHQIPKHKGKAPKSLRVARNSRAIKSQWVDIDVGPTKSYPTRADAARALAATCKALKLPAPMIVASGRGLHVYWPFTREVPARDAQHLMEGFAAAITQAGLEHDPSRTADLASVLRPIGTHHRKGKPLSVKLLRDADPVDPDQFYSRFADVTPPPRMPAVVVDDEWGTGQERDYPPSSGLQIIASCGALREVAESGGDVEEPLWRSMLGIVKHCTEGEELAHEWSCEHPQYNADETSEKYDNWSAGPTTCDQFSKHSDACARCPHFGKIKSPIHLGYVDPEEMQHDDGGLVSDDDDEPPTPAAKPRLSKAQQSVVSYAGQEPKNIPFWPYRYRWDGQFMTKFVPPADPGDQGMWVPFMNRLAYPYMRYADEEGEMQLRVSVQVNQKHNTWREFDLPAKALAENRQFNNAAGAYEVYTMGDKGTTMSRHFFQDVIGQMQDLNIETQAHTNFGWHEDAFVIGTSAITSKGAHPVFLSDRIPSDTRVDFGTKGTAAEWTRLISTIYNREGAEPYQFMICAGFGAPLVSLAGSDLWHGIPIALTGEGGLGKTTTCMVACSMYGEPGRFAISTNELGSTMNALISRVGLMRHLPLVLDEMTGRKTEELQGMLYALSNGKPKERNRGDGTLIDTNNRWDTLTFITGNMNITSMLAQLDKHRAEATQLRCFEIQLDDGFNDRVFQDLNAKDVIEHQLLGNNYGEAGREYLEYVIKNRVAVTQQVIKMRSRFTPNSRDQTRERFYYDCIATALVGGAIAKKLGLIDFDLKKIQDWAFEHIKSLRINRVANLSTVEDYLADFLASLHGRTVTTEQFNDARTGIVYEVDSKEVRWPICRIARGDKKMFVVHKHLVEWCGERNVHVKWFKDELDKRGLLKLDKSHNQTTKVSIFKGTSLPSTQTTCVELDYDRLMGRTAGSNLTVVNTKAHQKPTVGRPKGSRNKPK